MHGIRLFPIGLAVLFAATVNAQSRPVSATPAGANAGAVSKPVAAQTAAAQPAPEAVPVAEAAPAPELPKRPAELPPKPPKVTCHGEQLTISADNSTLDAILAGVRGCTGARIDVPSDAGRIRSFEELGPGPVREVLDQLLSGTPYNYVIQSSEANPLKVEQVLLSHPDVETAAAFPVRSELAEDEVMVAIVRRAGCALDETEVIRFCAPRMPYFAVPRYVEFVDALPATENGKIQKYKLRERGITERTWDRERAGITVKRR